MEKFPQLAEERLRYELPSLFRAVRHGQKKPVVTTLSVFHQDPMLLYMAVWYATSRGKGIAIAAADEFEGELGGAPPNAGQKSTAISAPNALGTPA